MDTVRVQMCWMEKVKGRLIFGGVICFEVCFTVDISVALSLGSVAVATHTVPLSTHSKSFQETTLGNVMQYLPCCTQQMLDQLDLGGVVCSAKDSTLQ